MAGRKYSNQNPAASNSWRRLHPSHLPRGTGETGPKTPRDRRSPLVGQGLTPGPSNRITAALIAKASMKPGKKPGKKSGKRPGTRSGKEK